MSALLVCPVCEARVHSDNSAHVHDVAEMLAADEGPNDLRLVELLEAVVNERAIGCAGARCGGCLECAIREALGWMKSPGERLAESTYQRVVYDHAKAEGRAAPSGAPKALPDRGNQ